MNLQIKVRLGIMMFFEYVVWATWYVTVGTWLSSTLHFTGEQVGLIAGTTALGAMIAPFVGTIADKLFATEKFLGTLHLVGGVFLLLASQQHSFGAIYITLLLHCLCYMPTMALANSLTFRLIRDPQKEFGSIRVLGTAGWIVASLVVGYMRLEASALPLMFGAGASFVMGLYCFTMPHIPPPAKGEKLTARSFFPIEAVSLLKERSMAIFAIASFLVCIPLQFYYAFTNLFLNQAGVVNAAGKMSAGQMSELFCMLLIPFFFRRFGVKYMLAAGMLAWVMRYVFFAYGNADSGVWMFWLGILLHGICYDFFFVTGQIYIDRKAPAALRSAAQGLIAFITYGLGLMTGSWISGLIVDHYVLHVPVVGRTYDWRSIWLVAAVTSAMVLVLFLLFFREKKEIEIESTAMEPIDAIPL
jgi:nucleoside transporter